MPRIRKIQRNPDTCNFYLVDANFLVNRYLDPRRIPNPNEKTRVLRSKAWWKEIDRQLKSNNAIVYVPDVCIAEAFKTLAKKYYKDQYFKSSLAFKNARSRLARDLRTPSKALQAANRRIKFHDISTSRDIIIACDRFYEVFWKHEPYVGIPDLIILATAKYLIDFYRVPSERLYIVTLDNGLWRGSKYLQDIPRAFNPNTSGGLAEKVFE